MGKPTNPEEYVCFQDGKLEIYLARAIFDWLGPETEKLVRRPGLWTILAVF